MVSGETLIPNIETLVIWSCIYASHAVSKFVNACVYLCILFL